jgi:hypothetical protein
LATGNAAPQYQQVTAQPAVPPPVAPLPATPSVSRLNSLFPKQQELPKVEIQIPYWLEDEDTLAR